MEFLILTIVIIGALIAIASAIWVAFALGRAISTDDKTKIPFETKET
jgi:energy-converting hydrogenase Eha subunit A